MCDQSKMYPLQTFPKFFNFYTESLLSLLITKVAVLDTSSRGQKMSKMNKRLVRERLANWESRNNSLTSLSSKQKDVCIQISSTVSERRIPTDVRRVIFLVRSQKLSNLAFFAGFAGRRKFVHLGLVMFIHVHVSPDFCWHLFAIDPYLLAIFPNYCNTCNYLLQIEIWIDCKTAI